MIAGLSHNPWRSRSNWGTNGSALDRAVTAGRRDRRARRGPARARRRPRRPGRRPARSAARSSASPPALPGSCAQISFDSGRGTITESALPPISIGSRKPGGSTNSPGGGITCSMKPALGQLGGCDRDRATVAAEQSSARLSRPARPGVRGHEAPTPSSRRSTRSRRRCPGAQHRQSPRPETSARPGSPPPGSAPGAGPG